jgi:tellurite resistance protein TehA-like permease
VPVGGKGRPREELPAGSASPAATPASRSREDQTAGETQELTGRYILQWFSPRWFIFVMGTGALANVYELLSPTGAGPLHALAQAFLMIAMVAFAVAAAFMVVRFVVGWDHVLKEWRHSSLIQFYSTISIASAVCATGLVNIPVAFIPPGAARPLATVFWWIALVDGLFFLVFGPFKVTSGSHAQPRRALGFWFLSPVGLFVLVFAGNFRAMHMSGEAAIRAMLLLNTIILGVAIPLTVIFYAIILFRSLFYNFPRRDVAPSFMIGVAPPAVSIIAINTLLPLLARSGVDAVDPAVVGTLVRAVSILLWGFGLWWLVYALVVVIHYFVRHGVPVTLGYGAFIFPPAAYAIASILLGKTFGIPLLRSVAVVLGVAFGLWWFVNVVLGIRGMLNRTIFDVAPTFKGDIPYL